MVGVAALVGLLLGPPVSGPSVSGPSEASPSEASPSEDSAASEVGTPQPEDPASSEDPTSPNDAASPGPHDRVTVVANGPEGCADTTTVRAYVDGYLAQANDGDDVAAELSIVQGPDGIVASLQLTTATGRSTRELAAESCDALADAVALVIAMAVDPMLAVDTTDAAPPLDSEAPPEPEPLPEPERQPLQQPAPEPEPEPEPVITPRDRPPTPPSLAKPAATLGGLLFAAAGVSGGLAPGAGAVIDGGAGLQWTWLRVAVQGSYHVLRDRPVAAGSVAFSAWGVGAHACYAPRVGRFGFSACAAVEAGQVDGAGRDLPSTASVARPWLGVGARGGADVEIVRWLRATVMAQGLAHAVVPTFTISGIDDPIHQAAPVGGRIVGGLEVRFP